MILQIIILILLFTIIYSIFKYTTIKYKLMVHFTTLKTYLKKNENKVILYLNQSNIKINNLLNVLNNNELIQELIHSNKLPVRFFYLFTIILKTLTRLINYILNYLMAKK